MAKKPAKSTINVGLLAAIAAATVSPGFMYVSPADGEPLANHNPALIEVNHQMVDPADATKAAARISAAGTEYLAATRETSPAATTEAPVSQFALLKGVTLPVAKRGKQAGAPSIYPFDTMEIGDSFFVAVSEKHPDPVKTMGSTVSSANARFSEPTGETKTVSRTKRGPGNKAVKNPDGTNVKENTTVVVKKQTRKFALRKIEANKVYGAWTAPANGALVMRVELSA